MQVQSTIFVVKLIKIYCFIFVKQLIYAIKYIFSQNMMQIDYNKFSIRINPMFRFNCAAVDFKIQTHQNITKIRCLLSKTLAQLRTSPKIFGDNPQSPKKRSDSNTEPESIEQVHQSLKKGFLVLKHSRRTKEPHTKIAYLSKDNKWLCWKSLDREDEKRFLVSSIVKVVKQGYKSYIIDQSQLVKPNCCVVVVSTSRNLQLEAASEFQAEMLKYELNRARKHSQQMCQNYTYHKE